MRCGCFRFWIRKVSEKDSPWKFGEEFTGKVYSAVKLILLAGPEAIKPKKRKSIFFLFPFEKSMHWKGLFLVFLLTSTACVANFLDDCWERIEVPEPRYSNVFKKSAPSFSLHFMTCACGNKQTALLLLPTSYLHLKL